MAYSALQELVLTERTYCESTRHCALLLQKLHEKYPKNWVVCQASKAMTQLDHFVQSNYEGLEKACSGEDDGWQDFFLKWSDGLEEAYLPYVCVYAALHDALNVLGENRNAELSAFLILPISRIPRYRLLQEAVQVEDGNKNNLEVFGRAKEKLVVVGEHINDRLKLESEWWGVRMRLKNVPEDDDSFQAWNFVHSALCSVRKTPKKKDSSALANLYLFRSAALISLVSLRPLKGRGKPSKEEVYGEGWRLEDTLFVELEKNVWEFRRHPHSKRDKMCSVTLLDLPEEAVHKINMQIRWASKPKAYVQCRKATLYCIWCFGRILSKDVAKLLGMWIWATRDDTLTWRMLKLSP